MPSRDDILRLIRQSLAPTAQDFIENTSIRLCLTDVHLTLASAGSALRLDQDITDFDDATFEPMGSMTYDNSFFHYPLYVEELSS